MDQELFLKITKLLREDTQWIANREKGTVTYIGSQTFKITIYFKSAVVLPVICEMGQSMMVPSSDQRDDIMFLAQALYYKLTT